MAIYDDITNLEISTALSDAVLNSASAQAAAAFTSLCWVDGELLSYTGATLTGANAYDLTGLWRGLYGTPDKPHASGVPFARLDSQILKFSYQPNLVGSTIYVKFQSVNPFGQQPQALSDCTAYPVVLTPQIAIPDAITGLMMTSWAASLNLACAPAARATSYRWDIYKADGATLIASYTTGASQFSYTSAQAATDGVQRAYVVRCPGVNAGGAGPSMATGVLSLAAPAVVTPATPTINTGEALIPFTPEASAVGYVAYYYATPGTNPSTGGTPVVSAVSPISIFAPAATYYFVLAPFDGWTSNPAFLNFSSEQSFTITVSGTPPSGGAGGTAGTGYMGAGGGRGQGQLP